MAKGWSKDDQKGGKGNFAAGKGFVGYRTSIKRARRPDWLESYLDEVVIYDRALNGSEVSGLFLEGAN